jgi:hypothetical protein
MADRIRFTITFNFLNRYVFLKKRMSENIAIAYWKLDERPL